MKKYLYFLALFLSIFFSSYVLADSLYFDGKSISEPKNNISMSAKSLILEAQNCIKDMEERGLKVSRVNESLQEILQSYAAQIALEERKIRTDYRTINQSAIDICELRDISFKSYDEFLIFNESYFKSMQNFNLSSIQQDYDNVVKSFDEERFEDSLNLINIGYKSLSDLESTQTSFKLFYDSTTRSIKDFLIENWKGLSIWFSIIFLLVVIFWKAINREIIQIQLKNLEIRKKAINNLIKKVQYEYFKDKTLSETQYNIKLKTFNDMLREIDRQIPELYEALAKVNKNKDAFLGAEVFKSKSVKKKKFTRRKVFKRSR